MSNGNGKLRFYVTEQISENIAKTPEGYLLCTGVPITRTGEFIYKADEVPVQADGSGMVRIQRDEADVFAEETIKSFEGKPICVDHPTEPVTPENWSELAHGTVQNVRRGEGIQSDLMIADLLITTAQAIELVEAGLRELSCGYDANYLQISEGVGRQKDIVGNHIALVMRGRAGKRCAIADKACINCGNCECDNKNKKVEEVEMKVKEKIGKFRKWLDSLSDADIAELEKEDEKKKAKDAEELPVKLKELKDTYDKWLKDAAEGKLDVSKLPVELKEVHDQDEEEEKKKVAKDQEEEEEEKKVKDQLGIEGKVDDLEEKIESLTAIIEELVASDKSVHESMDKKIKDDEAAKASEESEKASEEKKTVEDSWPEVAHRVEVLNPGMKIKKPIKDHGKVLREIKAAALTGAYTRDDLTDFLSAFSKDGKFSELTPPALDAAFIAASEMVARINNSKVQSRSIKTADFGSANTVRDINKRNKEYYAKKVA